MIQMIVTKYCPDRGRDNLVRNGTDCKGAQKLRCNNSGVSRTLDATVRDTPERRKEFLRAYPERSTRSVRGIRRTFPRNRIAPRGPVTVEARPS